MNRYIKGIGSIWVGPDTPPSNATNCLWLKQTKDTLSSYQLLYYNINKSLGRWETVTPGYLLFDNLRGIATPSPEFFPIESNDYLAYIGAGKGEYTNFIQDNGKPIVINSDSSIVLLYKEKDSSYWTYKEVECKGHQGLSAYDSAVLGGYSNTLDQFYLDLASIGNKVDKIPGKGLSTNDYTDQDKFQVNTINNKVNKNELTEVAFSGKHKDLLDTTEVDCHPIQSITGLQEELDFLKGSGRFAHLDGNNKVIETANNSDKLNNKSESELEVKLAQQAIADQDGNKFTTTYLKKTDLPKIIKNVEYNNSNGRWIFTFVDETTYNVNQPIANIIQSVQYTKDTKTLTITMWNNQVFNTILDIPTVIYTPEETDSILISIVGDKISAIVKDYISKTEVNALLKTKVDQDDLGSLAYKNNIDYSEVANAPTKLSQFNNDIISEWALALSKPTYTWEEILSKPTQYTPAPHTHTVLDITNLSDNYLAKALKGAPNGIAELDSTGKVPADQLPESGFLTGTDESLGVSYCYRGTDPKTVTITLPEELVGIIGSGESTVSALRYALSLQSTAYYSLNTILIEDAYDDTRNITIDHISSEIKKLVFADAVTKLTPLEFYMVIPTTSSKVLDSFFHLKGVPNYNEISIDSNWSSITLGMESGTPYAIVDMSDGTIAAKNFRTRYIQSTLDISSLFGEGKVLYYRYLGKDPDLVKVPISSESVGLEFFVAYLTATFSTSLLGNLDNSNLSYVIDQTNTTLLSSITDGSNFITKLCKGIDFYVEPINQILSDSVIPVHDTYVKYSDGVNLISGAEGSLPANLSKESLIIEIPNFISFVIRYDSTDSKVKITDYILLRSNKTSKNIWTGSQSEYDGLQSKDQNTIYIITE